MKWQIGLFMLVAMGLMTVSALASEPVAGQPAGDATVNKMVGLGLAAALAGGLAILGAGYAVGRVGSAALGTLAERPELFVRALVFVALAEGLAVLGFAVAILLYMKM
ncbi:MAG: ATP synthase subunit C [Planctomycetota bacterium]|nr:ATP synthase subunit C [Planctomycetota bacterium]